MLRSITALALLAACFVSPAKAETTLCTEITSLPATLSVQGIYCLKHDLSTGITAGNAITIAANNITIDCNGFKVGGLTAGAGTRAHGFHATDRANVTIRDCNIRGFYRGIVLDGTASAGHLIEGNALNGNTYLGMRIQGEGNTIRGNRIVNTGGTDDPNGTYGGILFNGSSGRIADNDIAGAVSTGNLNSLKGIYVAGPRNVVESNRISDLVAPAAGQVKAIMLIGNPTEMPLQTILRGNSVLMPPGTQGYAIYVKVPSSVCRDNDLLGFDAAWLESQTTNELDACTDAGGNVTK
ncbi:MAG TPA: right-handed parallel beta-helix repeat-containing protein [Lysobacter sp.]